MATQARAIFSVDACVIRLLEGENLTLLAASGLPPQFAHPSLPVHWGISREILERRQPIYIPDVAREPKTAVVRNRMPQSFQFTSYAGAPMLAGSHVIGILGVYTIRKRRSFSGADLDCLQILANSISVAVANEHLYQQALRSRDELQEEVNRRNRAETLLREGEERLRLAAQAAHMFAFEWNPITDEVVRSADCASILGIEIDATRDTGQGFFAKLHPDDRPRFLSVLQSMTPNRPTYSTSYRILRSDGAVAFLEESGHAFFDNDGRLIRLVGMTADVTESVRREEENQRLREELAHVARVTTMGELAATIAHDVNQPLAAIIGNAQASQHLLNSAAPDIDEVRAALADIVKDGRRATSVIEGVRDFLRRGDSEHAAFDINQLIQKVAAFLRRELARGRITLELELADHLLPVRGNQTELQQVLLNLLINATEAVVQAPRTRRLIRVVTALASESDVRVSVLDSGVGLPSDRARLFEPFFTTKPRGLGMGLAISRTIVENHRGRLWAEDREVGGTAFHLQLPARPEK